jgi:hypothetical protein
VQNRLKTLPKNVFLKEFKKKTREMLERMRWSRGGLCWKVALVSFLYIYSKCAVSEKFLYFLTYPHIKDS